MTFRLRRLTFRPRRLSSSSIDNSNETTRSPIFRAPSSYNNHNWTIPKVDVDTIYKISTFDFIRAYLVKTQEKIIS